MERFPDAAFPARPQERGLIRELLLRAFPAQDEADLVETLRREDRMALELITPRDGEVVAYVALCRMVAPDGWLCLAPLAVDPAMQGQGLGSHLVRRALDWAAGRIVVVLGDPDYYGRFGFSGARAARLTSMYPITHTMIAGGGAGVPEGALIYPAAFDAL